VTADAFHGNPCFLIDGRVALSGAHEPEIILGVIEETMRNGDA
jgi:predicted DsbA family dithiol-disulfide isomerase